MEIDPDSESDEIIASVVAQSLPGPELVAVLACILHLRDEEIERGGNLQRDRGDVIRSIGEMDDRLFKRMYLARDSTRTGCRLFVTATANSSLSVRGSVRRLTTALHMQ